MFFLEILMKILKSPDLSRTRLAVTKEKLIIHVYDNNGTVEPFTTTLYVCQVKKQSSIDNICGRMPFLYLFTVHNGCDDVIRISIG